MQLPSELSPSLSLSYSSFSLMLRTHLCKIICLWKIEVYRTSVQTLTDTLWHVLAKCLRCVVPYLSSPSLSLSLSLPLPTRAIDTCVCVLIDGVGINRQLRMATPCVLHMSPAAVFLPALSAWLLIPVTPWIEGYDNFLSTLNVFRR